MQMGKVLYYAVDRSKRAREFRADALQCALAGFPTMAEVLYQSAELLCPTPASRDEDKQAPRVRKGYQSGKSESANGGSVGVVTGGRGAYPRDRQRGAPARQVAVSP